MFLLEIQTIVGCSMLDKLVELGEHYRRIRKPKNNDTFLYQHFKRTGHSPNNVIVQPVEKISYDENSSVRFKNIKRFETELKCIKLLQTPFPLGFNDNIYHEGNISKMPDFDVLTLSESRKRKSRSHGIREKGNDKRKRCATMKLNTSLNDLAVKLRIYGRHIQCCLILVLYLLLYYVPWTQRLIDFTIEIIKCMTLHC